MKSGYRGNRIWNGLVVGSCCLRLPPDCQFHIPLYGLQARVRGGAGYQWTARRDRGRNTMRRERRKTYMYSSMKFRLCIKWIRLQVCSRTKVMGSSFSVRHPLQVSQASKRAIARQRARGARKGRKNK
jgi:hypothetical protein